MKSGISKLFIIPLYIHRQKWMSQGKNCTRLHTQTCEPHKVKMDVEALRYFVDKNTLPEKDFCSMVLLLLLLNGTVHSMKSCFF